MSLRLLPFRQYDENDVINMFALDSSLALESTTGDGEGSAGVFVKVTAGDLDNDTITYGTNSYLGKTDYPFVGPNMYPTNPLTLSGAASGELPLGITLNQTAKTDENGEKLLYNAQKKEELQAVLPGQTVPVATKGIFTLAATAFDGGINDHLADADDGYAIGSGIKISQETPGKITGCHATLAESFGTIIATGNRASQGGLTDQFAGEFMVIKIG